jgi:hypothetical protein
MHFRLVQPWLVATVVGGQQPENWLESQEAALPDIPYTELSVLCPESFGASLKNTVISSTTVAILGGLPEIAAAPRRVAFDRFDLNNITKSFSNRVASYQELPHEAPEKNDQGDHRR